MGGALETRCRDVGRSCLMHKAAAACPAGRLGPSHSLNGLPMRNAFAPSNCLAGRAASGHWHRPSVRERRTEIAEGMARLIAGAKRRKAEEPGDKG